MKTNEKSRVAAIVVLGVLVVGLPAGIGIWFMSGSQSPVRRIGIDPPSPVPATTPSSGTTAEFYRSVNQMLAVDCPASSNITYPDYPPFGAEWDRMAKAAWDAGQPGLVRVRGARSIKEADWPTYDSANSDRVRYLNPIRNVANHLGDAALYQHFLGDDAGATETIKDLFVLSDLLEQKPAVRGSLIRLLVAAGIRALANNRILVIASDVRLSSDPADHQALQTATARWLVDKLLIQNDPNAAWTGAIEGGHVDVESARQAMARFIETFNRANADQAFAAMSLACHLFFHDRGRWPNSIDELIPAYLPHQSVDPWGDGHQMIGYVLVKGGLPDGSDRPMVYSRCGSPARLFYRVDGPQYGYYWNDESNANRPHHNPSGQFRDVTRWLPTAGSTQPATRSLE